MVLTLFASEIATVLAGQVDGSPEEPALRPGLDESEVTPGIEGFLMTFLMAALVIIVARLMVRSVRRVKMRSEEAEEMLIERNQPHLSEAQREQGRPEFDELAPDRIDTLRRKYPGYLDSPPLEPQAPDADMDPDNEMNALGLEPTDSEAPRRQD